MTGQKIHFEIIYRTALLLIAIGVAADNLMVAGISRNGTAVFSVRKSLLLGFLLFLIQNTMLYWAKVFTDLASPFVSYQEEWMALLLLYFIAANNLRDWRSANCRKEVTVRYTADNILLLAFATASYILAFGIAIYWLHRMDTLVTISLQCFIAVFLGLGLLLGRKHQVKWLKMLHNICTVLLVLGITLLLFLTI